MLNVVDKYKYKMRLYKELYYKCEEYNIRISRPLYECLETSTSRLVFLRQVFALECFIKLDIVEAVEENLKSTLSSEDPTMLGFLWQSLCHNWYAREIINRRCMPIDVIVDEVVGVRRLFPMAILAGMFNWRMSKEGEEFWSKINKELQSMVLPTNPLGYAEETNQDMAYIEHITLIKALKNFKFITSHYGRQNDSKEV